MKADLFVRVLLAAHRFGSPRRGRRASGVPARSAQLKAERAFRSADGGVVELSGEVIESLQRLHSNAYKFPAKARLMICKDIGRPQMGQATPSLGVGTSLMSHLSMRRQVLAMT
jgi:hypothetical protein